MSSYNIIRIIASAGIASLLLCGCNGLFDGIYDTPPDEGTSSITTNGDNIIHFDNLQCTSYSEWIYIDIHRGEVTDTLDIPTTLTGEWDGKSGFTYNHVVGEQITPLKVVPTDAMQDAEQWDIAIHHFDVKTNGCAALETEYTSLDQLPPSSDAFIDQTFTPDEWTTHQVIYDISNMLNYDIGYQNSMCNLVLSRWVTMNFNTPPPTFSATGRVYIIRLQDNTYAAMKLNNYISPKGVKGFLSFDIKYPY